MSALHLKQEGNVTKPYPIIIITIVYVIRLSIQLCSLLSLGTASQEKESFSSTPLRADSYTATYTKWHRR